MEFAAAALSAIAGTVTSAIGLGGSTAATAGNFIGAGLTAAGGAGAAGGGLSGLLGTGSLLTSILGGTATVAGMLGAVQAGEEQARSLNAQAMDARTEQDIERIRGAERRDSLRRSLLQTLGERDVAAAASGVDLSFGTPSLAREEAERDAERAFSVDQSTEDFRVARLEERANEFTRSAKSARRAGRLKAFGLGVQGAAAVGRRFG